MPDDRAEEIAATFERIRRPLQWPMENFRRSKVSSRSFTGYRFSRVRRNSVAGFAFGFALREGGLPGVRDPPEVVAYAFVRPTGSALYEELARQPKGAVRKLVASSRRMGFPFEWFPGEETVAVRHRSLRTIPREIFVLAASDFLMLCYHPLRAAGFLERVTKATTRPGP